MRVVRYPRYSRWSDAAHDIIRHSSHVPRHPWSHARSGVAPALSFWPPGFVAWLTNFFFRCFKIIYRMSTSFCCVKNLNLHELNISQTQHNFWSFTTSKSRPQPESRWQSLRLLGFFIRIEQRMQCGNPRCGPMEISGVIKGGNRKSPRNGGF